MKTRIKILTALLLAVLFVLSLAGCGKAVKPEDDRKVITIGGYDIAYDLFRYIFLNVRNDLCGGDLSLYENNIQAQAAVPEQTVSVLRDYCAIRSLAEKNGVVIDDFDSRFDTYFADYESAAKAENTTAEEDMKKVFHTRYSLRQMFEIYTLREALYAKLTAEGGSLYLDDEAMKKEIEDNFLCLRLIFVDQSGTETEEYALSRINEALEKAKAGEDFASLVEKYSEVSSLGDAKDYTSYYAKGEISYPEIEEAYEKLDEGEISDIIETDDGWFIIQRTEKSEEYISENLASLKGKYAETEFSAMISAEAEELEVKYHDAFGTFNVLTVK